MEAFLLVAANREFAEGRGPYQPKDLTSSVRATRMLSKILLVAGVLATLGAGAVYLYQELKHEELLASVKPVTAQVSGCEGPGRYQHVRFRYAVDGKVYDQSAYAQKPEFRWPSTIDEACQKMTVNLSYVASDPNRWSAAFISPLTLEEREDTPNTNVFIAGPIVLALAGALAFASFLLRKQIARQGALKATGIVLKGELIKMDEDASQESPYPLVCFYQFNNPAGVLLKGKSLPYDENLKKSEYPPPGTPVYVVYASDQTFDML